MHITPCIILSPEYHFSSTDKRITLRWHIGDFMPIGGISETPKCRSVLPKDYVPRSNFPSQRGRGVTNGVDYF